MRGNLPWTSVLQGARSRANAAAAGREDAVHSLNGNSPRLFRQGALSVAAPGADPRGCHRQTIGGKAMIDHIYLPVSDLERSSEFYKKMLEPLGIDMPYKFDQLHGFAINSNPGFWLKNGKVAKDLYVAFTAKTADAVRASYKAAIDAGATSNKEPSLRPEWRADYFAANIGDPDGYNIEIAYKPWLYK